MSPARRLARRLAILVALLALALPGYGHGYSERLIRLLEADDRAGAYRWLLAQPPPHDDPAYNEWLAQLAGEQGDWATRIRALERLLDHTPHHLGARLDLVMAYQTLGQPVRAAQRLRALLAELDATAAPIPPAAAAALQQLRQQLLPPRSRIRHGGRYELGLGWDSNANLGVREATVSINLQGELPVELELASESREQPDHFAFQRLQWQTELPHPWCLGGANPWCATTLVDLATRHYHHERRQDQQQFAFAGALSRVTGQHTDQWVLTGQTDRDSDRQRRFVLGLEYNRTQPLFTGSGGYALRYDLHHQPDSTLDPSHQFSASWYQQPHPYWSYRLTTAYHRRPDHPAGNTLRARLAGHFSHPWREWTTTASLGATWEQDTAPFSYLLFGDRQRRDRELQFSLAATRPLAPRWSTRLSATYTHSTSNIPLLERRRYQFGASLNFHW